VTIGWSPPLTNHAREAAAFAGNVAGWQNSGRRKEARERHQDGGVLDHRLAIDEGRNLADGVEGKIGRIV
jgi:hypothetical protein